MYRKKIILMILQSFFIACVLSHSIFCQSKRQSLTKKQPDTTISYIKRGLGVTCLAGSAYSFYRSYKGYMTYTDFLNLPKSSVILMGVLFSNREKSPLNEGYIRVGERKSELLYGARLAGLTGILLGATGVNLLIS